jgi:tripartite-type tricarboxylate transporter receptor subunit TctC
MTLPEHPSREARRRLLRAAAATAVPILWPPSAPAQAWPARPIRLIAPSAPGGPTDLIARLLAERFTAGLGTPVVVENRTGGTGTVALDAIAKAPPDGYTIGVGFTGANVIYPLLNPKLPFNALTDFTPIGRIATNGNVLVVHPSVPAASLGELLAWVKTAAQTAPVAYGSWGNGSGGHLAGEYLKILTGVDMYHVPYRSTTALTVDMVGGHMKIGFLDPSNALAQVRAGKMRALALTGAERAASLPDVPTMVEQGVPFGIGVWYGLFGPAGMPPAIVARLNAELLAALRAPDLAERWVTIMGARPGPSSPEALARLVQDDWETWKAVIARSKIVLE